MLRITAPLDVGNVVLRAITDIMGKYRKKERETHPFGWKNSTHFYTLDETLHIF